MDDILKPFRKDSTDPSGQENLENVTPDLTSSSGGPNAPYRLSFQVSINEEHEMAELPFSNVGMIELNYMEVKAQSPTVPSLSTKKTILVLRRGIRSEVRILRSQTRQIFQKEHVDENRKLTRRKRSLVAY